MDRLRTTEYKGKVRLSLRVIDIPATSAFMLTDDSPELRQIFGEEMPIPAFTDPTDLRAKAIYYLNADHERRQIASRMHARVKQTDTYADRMCQIVTQQ